VEKRETAIERLCMETASMAVFYTQDSCFIIFATVGYKKDKPSN